MDNLESTIVTLHAIEHLTIKNLLVLNQEWAKEHKAHCGYPLLCSIPLSSEVAMRELRSLLRAVENWDHKVVMCFDPRHIFSFDIGYIHYDLIVCYECNSIRLLRDGEFIKTILSANISSQAAEAIFIDMGIQRRLDNQ